MATGPDMERKRGRPDLAWAGWALAGRRGGCRRARWAWRPLVAHTEGRPVVVLRTKQNGGGGFGASPAGLTE